MAKSDKQKLKVRVFSTPELSSLEEKINQWFVENPNIEVLRIAQTSADHAVIVSIFYSEVL